ncbi:MAG: hypothetical protein CV089_24525 [Nitrospira sp. WS110]|nr:hypothetical protein [Nitrospira sp. WS110]
MSHKMDDGFVGLLFIAVGVTAVIAGFWIRRIYWLSKDWPRETWSSKTSLYLIAYGLAAMTTSPLVHVAVGFTCMASWLDRMGQEHRSLDEWSSVSAMKEGALLGSVALAALILVGARGVLPFQ